MFAGKEFVEPVARVVLAAGLPVATDYAMVKLAIEQGYLHQQLNGGRITVTPSGVELLAVAALQNPAAAGELQT